MTGEAHAVHKGKFTEKYIHDVEPILISGTQVNKGTGAMLVIATGVRSMNGRLKLSLSS